MYPYTSIPGLIHSSFFCFAATMVKPLKLLNFWRELWLSDTDGLIRILFGWSRWIGWVTLFCPLAKLDQLWWYEESSYGLIRPHIYCLQQQSSYEGRHDTLITSTHYIKRRLASALFSVHLLKKCFCPKYFTMISPSLKIENVKFQMMNKILSVLKSVIL